jgi:hypothetical protein
MLTKLKAAVLPVLEIEVEDKIYKLVLDMNALAKASDELNRDFSSFTSWQGLTGPDITVLAWAALDRHHPDVTLREVRQWLGPVDPNQLYVMLIEASWPGITERIEKILRDQKKEKAEGKPEPNPQESLK